MQSPKIVSSPTRLFVGHRIETTLIENRAFELWNGFKPKAHTINHRLGSDFFSLQVYSEDIPIHAFTPHTAFIKWAAVEVSNAVDIPDGMQVLSIDSGKYAVFIHKGTPAMFPATLQYIFTKWLPKSGFSLDKRPHFEVLGEKYKVNDVESEEEVWIPIL